MNKSITIRWLGHASYKIIQGNTSVVLDPFAPGSVPGFQDICETANLVLCSHGHHDHGYTQAVTLQPGDTTAFTVTKLETFHDDAEGAKRGPNTIHVLDAGGVRIVHFGDLGCELTEEQKETLRGADVFLIPVGGFYTIDAAQAKAVIDELQPKVTIPMHYRTEKFGLPAIAPLDDFLALCTKPVLLGKNTFTVGEVESGIVVLDY